MTGRRRPRRLADALGAVRSEAAPATPLGAVQNAWHGVVGDAVAAQAEPVAERAGMVTVACESATWAQELDLLAPDLLERLNAALARGGSPAVSGLRFTADASRHR